jgi:acetyl esterase/lipase
MREIDPPGSISRSPALRGQLKVRVLFRTLCAAMLGLFAGCTEAGEPESGSVDLWWLSAALSDPEPIRLSGDGAWISWVTSSEDFPGERLVYVASTAEPENGSIVAIDVGATYWVGTELYLTTTAATLRIFPPAIGQPRTIDSIYDLAQSELSEQDFDSVSEVRPIPVFPPEPEHIRAFALEFSDDRQLVQVIDTTAGRSLATSILDSTDCVDRVFINRDVTAASILCFQDFVGEEVRLSLRSFEHGLPAINRAVTPTPRLPFISRPREPGLQPAFAPDPVSAAEMLGANIVNYDRLVFSPQGEALFAHSLYPARQPMALTASAERLLERLSRRILDDTEISVTVVDVATDQAAALFRIVKRFGAVTYLLYRASSDDLVELSFAEPSVRYRSSAIEIPKPDGRGIPTVVLRRADNTPPRGVLLSLHGGPRGHYDLEADLISQAYLRQGYVVVLPNYSGSDGTGEANASAAFAPNFGADLEDVNRVAEWVVAEAPFGDDLPLTLLGGSYGGYLGFNFLRSRSMAAEQVDHFVAVSPLLDIESFVDRPEHWPEFARINLQRIYGAQSEPATLVRWRSGSVLASPIDGLPKIDVVFGSSDETVPRSQYEAFERIYAGNAAISIYHIDGGHVATIEQFGPLLDEIVGRSQDSLE